MANPAEYGGCEFQLQLSTEALKSKGLTHLVVTCGAASGSKAWMNDLKKRGISHLALGNLIEADFQGSLTLNFLVSATLQVLGAEILHLFNPACAPILTPAKRARLKIVYYEAGMPKRDAWWAPIAPHLNDFHHVIAVAKKSLDRLRSELGYEGKGTVICPLIELPPAGLRARLPHAKEFQLVYFGRMDANKGVETLLRAFVWVVQAFPLQDSV